jgi:hypothetical protein
MPIPAFRQIEVPHVDRVQEPLYLISFSRYPAELRNALLHGEHLEDGRQALKAAGYSHELNNGVKIFCTPGQYPTVEALPLDMYRPYHVIVSAHFLPLVRRTVEGLDRKLKVKIKDEKVIANIPSSISCDQQEIPLPNVDPLDFTPPCSPLFAWRSISDCTRDQLVDAWTLGTALGGKFPAGSVTPPWESLVWPGGVPEHLKMDSHMDSQMGRFGFGFPLPPSAVAAGTA